MRDYAHTNFTTMQTEQSQILEVGLVDALQSGRHG